MSNFDYIMALNTIAGRSYNDLCQVMFALTGNFHRHACPEYDSILSYLFLSLWIIMEAFLQGMYFFCMNIAVSRFPLGYRGLQQSHDRPIGSFHI